MSYFFYHKPPTCGTPDGIMTGNGCPQGMPITHDGWRCYAPKYKSFCNLDPQHAPADHYRKDRKCCFTEAAQGDNRFESLIGDQAKVDAWCMAKCEAWDACHGYHTTYDANRAVVCDIYYSGAQPSAKVTWSQELKIAKQIVAQVPPHWGEVKTSVEDKAKYFTGHEVNRWLPAFLKIDTHKLWEDRAKLCGGFVNNGCYRKPSLQQRRARAKAATTCKSAPAGMTEATLTPLRLNLNLRPNPNPWV
jgi:hypothetical protein